MVQVQTDLPKPALFALLKFATVAASAAFAEGESGFATGWSFCPRVLLRAAKSLLGAVRSPFSSAPPIAVKSKARSDRRKRLFLCSTLLLNATRLLMPVEHRLNYQISEGRPNAVLRGVVP
jgi:hypothetical protein